jgi:starch synthase
MRRYLSAADAGVFSSRHEGFPVAPLEAMACGLPLVAVDAEGIVDAAPHGEDDGVVIVPREDPAALAGAMTRVASDRALRARLAARARERITSAFSIETVGAQLAAFLRGASRG